MAHESHLSPTPIEAFETPVLLSVVLVQGHMVPYNIYTSMPIRSIQMSSQPKSSKPVSADEIAAIEKGRFAFISSFLHLPTNVYLLLFFTLGKGFQLPIPDR